MPLIKIKNVRSENQYVVLLRTQHYGGARARRLSPAAT